MKILKRGVGMVSAAASARSKDAYMSLGRNEPCHCGSGKKKRKRGPDGAFIAGSDFLMDGSVTASYFYGDLAPK
jgi:hypothetical protein